MSLEEFETLMRITVNLQNVIDNASHIIGGDSDTVESFKKNVESLKKAKEANETETVVPTRPVVPPIPVVPPRPIIQFENNTIISKPELDGGDWQWKTKGDEFWMPIKQNAMISNGAVRVIDQQTLKVSNILDITREINTKVRQKRRQPFKLTVGPEYEKILAQARKDILAEIQVQTEEIPVSDVGYSFDTVKKNMKKRIIGNPLLANHVPQPFYDRVTQLIIEGKTRNIAVADVLRVFPTIMLQPDRMAEEVLKIRKGFLIKVGPQPLPPPADNEPSAPPADNNGVPSAPPAGVVGTELALPAALTPPKATKQQIKEEYKEIGKTDAETDKYFKSKKGVDDAKAMKAAIAKAMARDRQYEEAKEDEEDKLQQEVDTRRAADTADTARKKAADALKKDARIAEDARIAAKDGLEQKQPQTPRPDTSTGEEKITDPDTEITEPVPSGRVPSGRGRDQTEIRQLEKLRAQLAQEQGETEDREPRDQKQQPVQPVQPARPARPGSFGSEKPKQIAQDRLEAAVAQEGETKGQTKEEEEEEEKEAVDAAVGRVNSLQQMETQMKTHFDLWTIQEEKDRNQKYMIEYNADNIYGELAAKAMRDMLDDTFSKDEWLRESKIDNNTTFAQLRPILVKLFPSCELHDLTDEQLNATVYDEDKYGAVTGLRGISPIKKIQILLRRMLKPDENEPDENGKYEPSKEVLQFNGYEDGYGEGTRLLSFTYVDAGYMLTSSTKRFFNPKLAENFYKIMSILKTQNAGRLENKEFFIYRNRTGFDIVYRNEGNKLKRSTLKEAKENHWTSDPLKKLKPAESHYPSPIPAGELSAMLAELSSMGNTSESEYATEEEEFASDSEEFASDDF